MTFISKFKTNLNLLQSAVNREIELDHANLKVYKKVLRFYRNSGIEFYNDPDDDYELVLELLAQDLY